MERVLFCLWSLAHAVTGHFLPVRLLPVWETQDWRSLSVAQSCTHATASRVQARTGRELSSLKSKTL